MTENEQPPVWERLADESSVAYAAFCEYRNLEPNNRSMRQVAEKLTKSEQLMRRWGAKYKWVARCLQYDVEEDRKFRADMNAKRRRAATRQIQASTLAQSKVAQFLLDLDPSKLTPQEAARWYEVAVKIERQALGVPDKIEVTNVDGGQSVEAMTPEEVLDRLGEIKREIESTLGNVQSE